MKIIVKDYSHIFDFIERNHGKINEAQMAALVKAWLDAEFASALVVEQFMWQAMPKTILGEGLIKHFGGLKNARNALPIFQSLSYQEQCEIVPELPKIVQYLAIKN